eukprot:Nk52_evm4s2524 gene=Nk52_evmTU4s2524
MKLFACLILIASICAADPVLGAPSAASESSKDNVLILGNGDGIFTNGYGMDIEYKCADKDSEPLVIYGGYPEGYSTTLPAKGNINPSYTESGFVSSMSVTNLKSLGGVTEFLGYAFETPFMYYPMLIPLQFSLSNNEGKSFEITSVRFARVDKQKGMSEPEYRDYVVGTVFMSSDKNGDITYLPEEDRPGYAGNGKVYEAHTPTFVEKGGKFLFEAHYYSQAWPWHTTAVAYNVPVVMAATKAKGKGDRYNGEGFWVCGKTVSQKGAQTSPPTFKSSFGKRYRSSSNEAPCPVTYSNFTFTDCHGMNVDGSTCSNSGINAVPLAMWAVVDNYVPAQSKSRLAQPVYIHEGLYATDLHFDEGSNVKISPELISGTAHNPSGWRMSVSIGAEPGYQISLGHVFYNSPQAIYKHTQNQLFSQRHVSMSSFVVDGKLTMPNGAPQAYAEQDEQWSGVPYDGSKTPVDFDNINHADIQVGYWRQSIPYGHESPIAFDLRFGKSEAFVVCGQVGKRK